MHRLPEYFPEPLKFNPDRWQSINSDRYSYIPFLAGPRTCIGNRFALTEMKTILAILLNKLSFRLVPETEIIRKMRLTMRPSPDLKLRISTI